MLPARLKTSCSECHAGMSKRPRLAELVGTKCVTGSALSAILSKINERGLESTLSTSRRSLGRALGKELDTKTTYGPVFTTVDLPLQNGRESFVWEVTDPAALLNWLCTYSQCFSDELLQRLHRHPCTRHQPWNIVIYCDEAVPGNLLSLDHSRKSYCFYWQFHEFGLWRAF